MTACHRVLVVDDDPAIRRLLKAILMRAGHEVDLAAEGGEALAALAKAPYDAVILDLMMPGVSGFEVIKELEKESSPHPKCIIVLSATSDRNLDDLQSPAIHSKIRKPFDLDKLLAQIEDCIGKG